MAHSLDNIVKATTPSIEPFPRIIVAAPTDDASTGPRIVTGSVTGAGAITAGTGFTVNRTGAGIYAVTYTVAFSATPCVVTQKADFTDNFASGLSAQSATGFTISHAADHAFTFIATTMV